MTFKAHIFQGASSCRSPRIPTPPTSNLASFFGGQKLFTLLWPRIVYTSGAKLRPRWPNMLRSRFGIQNQDFWASVGAIGIIFRNRSVPTGPREPEGRKINVIGQRGEGCPGFFSKQNKKRKKRKKQNTKKNVAPNVPQV